jgi:targeting protein for Xklp2
MADIENQQSHLRMEREKEELRELRKSLVPKAQPIHHYTPVQLKPSEKLLTVPRSPELQTSMRSRKHQNE